MITIIIHSLSYLFWNGYYIFITEIVRIYYPIKLTATEENVKENNKCHLLIPDSVTQKPLTGKQLLEKKKKKKHGEFQEVDGN